MFCCCCSVCVECKCVVCEYGYFVDHVLSSEYVCAVSVNH